MAATGRDTLNAAASARRPRGGAIVNTLIPLVLLVVVIIVAVAMSGSPDAGEAEEPTAGEASQRASSGGGTEEERERNNSSRSADADERGDEAAEADTASRNAAETNRADEPSGADADEPERIDEANPGNFRLVMGGETFKLETALTNETRHRGLSFRESIPRDGGMIFAFERRAPRAFVMRDCLVPIDIAFLADDGTIVRTYTMTVEPRREGESDAAYERRLRRYNSWEPVRLVAEFQAGTFARLGVRPGDRVEGDFDTLILLAEPLGPISP